MIHDIETNNHCFHFYTIEKYIKMIEKFYIYTEQRFI